MDKLMVVFPGIGYTKDRPLLHFIRRMASERDYDIICAEYDKAAFEGGKVYKKGVERCIKNFLENNIEKMLNYSEILFVGKSVGTVIAAAVGGAIYKAGYKNIRYIVLTPLKATFETMCDVPMSAEIVDRTAVAEGKDGDVETILNSYSKLPDEIKEYISGSNVAFAGDSDPMLSGEDFVKLAETFKIPYHQYQGGNHSIEVKGNVILSIEHLKDIMSKLDEII